MRKKKVTKKRMISGIASLAKENTEMKEHINGLYKLLNASLEANVVLLRSAINDAAKSLNPR